VAPSPSPVEVARILLSRLNAKEPVDIESVAGALQLHIRSMRSRAFIGASVRGDDGIGGLIVVDPGIRETGRKRFTIAHEIAHYVLLHNLGGPSVCSHTDVGTWRRDSRIERAADQFAAELLLPGQAVRSIVGEHGVTLKTAELIKSKFDASLTAAAFRCVELTEEECALVVTVKGVVKYYERSASWNYPILTKRAPAKSTMARKLIDNPIRRELYGIVPARVWARECQNLDLETELWEQSIYQVGYNTILSFLTVLS
jgi:hypothetical protein